MKIDEIEINDKTSESDGRWLTWFAKNNYQCKRRQWHNFISNPWLQSTNVNLFFPVNAEWKPRRDDNNKHQRGNLAEQGWDQDKEEEDRGCRR